MSEGKRITIKGKSGFPRKIPRSLYTDILLDIMTRKSEMRDVVHIEQVLPGSVPSVPGPSAPSSPSESSSSRPSSPLKLSRCRTSHPVTRTLNLLRRMNAILPRGHQLYVPFPHRLRPPPSMSSFRTVPASP